MAPVGVSRDFRIRGAEQMTQTLLKAAIASASGRIRHVPLPAAILFTLGLAPAGAQAAAIVVTDAGDSDVTSASTCTLRQAILSMNASTVSGDCVNSGDAFGSNDTINFAAGIDLVELADVADNVLHVTDLGLTIDAGAGRTVAIRRPTAAANEFGLVFADQGTSGSLSLVGLELSNGTGAHAALQKINKYGATAYEPTGGAVYASGDLRLDRCVLTGNSATSAAAVFVHGSLTMADGRVSGNQSMYLGAIAASSAVVQESSITGNIGEGASAGTFYTLTMSNTTVSGNVSHAANNVPKYAIFGSALVVGSSASVSAGRIDHSTVACNAGMAAAIYNRVGSEMTLESSIVANTQGSACAAFSPFDIAALNISTITGINNLVGKAQRVTFSDAQPSNANPLLLPLANNDGDTLTHALAQGSPAIDAGGASSEPYDQRGAGFPRVVGVASDIGAFEYGTPFDDGTCGSMDGAAPASLAVSAPGLCAVGSPLQFGGAGPWNWQCGDASGGARASCHASLTVTPALAWDKPFYSTQPDSTGLLLSAYVWGEPARLELSVNGDAPQGTVDVYKDTLAGPGIVFVHDHLQCGNVALVAGTAVCPVDTTVGLGHFYYEATFTSSDGDHVSNDVPRRVELFVGAASSTTTIVSTDPGTTVVGQPFPVSAQVAAVSPSVATPSGTITITDVTDGASCTAAAGSSAGACALVATTAETKTLRASFNGTQAANSTSLALKASQSGDVAWLVNPATTTTTWVPAGPVTLGASVTLAATVAVVAPGAGTPTGTITITDTTDALSCSYAATATTPGCSIQPPSTGAKTLTASYAGDGNFLASTASGTLVVATGASGAALASSANPSIYGAAVVLTATITPTASYPVPTGVVDFSDGATVLCAARPLAAVGQAASASCTAVALAGGSHVLKASYAGDANTQPSQATLTQVVDPAVTRVALASSANPSVQGQAVTFVATVSAAAVASAHAANVTHAADGAMLATAASAAAPGGTVSFTSDGAELAVVPLGTGTAGYTTIALTAGTHAIAASYSGDADHAPASFAITQTVDAPAIADPVAVPSSRGLLAVLAALLTAMGVLAMRRRRGSRAGAGSGSH
jgi:Bacterial Ig-like domain (group 3)